jgi:hypothetical protein
VPITLLMIKKSQIFAWKHEPAAERTAASVPSTHFGSLAAIRSRSDDDARADSTRPFAVAPTVVRRGPPNPRDQAVSGFATAWADALPQALRPHALCIRYPRSANRLALCWADPTLTDRFFAGLLVDNRGGRGGFPREVADELTRLRADATARMRRAGQ